MTYRNDVDALAARHAALEADVAVTTKARDAAANLLADAKARAKLPVLDNLRVASPCSADWNDMVGDDRVRMCVLCDKNVYNVSRMTRDEAEALLVAKEGRLCVRYFQRRDGTILLADCTIGKRAKRRRRVVAAAAAAMMAGGGMFIWKVVTDDPEGEFQPMMGQEQAIAVAGGIGPSELPPEVTSETDTNVPAELDAKQLAPQKLSLKLPETRIPGRQKLKVSKIHRSEP